MSCSSVRKTRTSRPRDCHGLQETSSPPPSDDTIVALITPPGEGGVAAVRLAGARSLTLLNRHFKPHRGRAVRPQPFLMRHGWFTDSDGSAIDEVLAVYMPAGSSYTGQEQVEIFCHGGDQSVRLIIDALIHSGAHAAQPGEFTRLAFLSGRIDLSQAEAVAAIIAANTNNSHTAARKQLLGGYSEHIGTLREHLVDVMAEIEASIDYPEEEIPTAERKALLKGMSELIGEVKDMADTYRGGRIIRDGFKVAIAGRPNAGKSSLFNLLLRQQRALVTPQPGTTRDYLSEWIDLYGYAVNIIDTAGLRTKGGHVEKIGQDAAMRVISTCDLIVWMVDISRKRWEHELGRDMKWLAERRNILVGNKIDLTPGLARKRARIAAGRFNLVPVSCLTGRGVKRFKDELSAAIRQNLPDLTSGVIVTEARHRQKLKLALGHLRKARTNIRLGESPELTAFDLRIAVNALDELTGRVYTEDILDKIFSRFCIGK